MLYELRIHSGELDLNGNGTILAHGDDDELCPCGRLPWLKHLMDVYLIEAPIGYWLKGLEWPEEIRPAKKPWFYYDVDGDFRIEVSDDGTWVKVYPEDDYDEPDIDDYGPEDSHLEAEYEDRYYVEVDY